MNTQTVSNVRKAPRKEKYLVQSIITELQAGLSLQQYLDEQADLDEEARLEEIRFAEDQEAEVQRREDEMNHERYMDYCYDWDDQYFASAFDYDMEPFN